MNLEDLFFDSSRKTIDIAVNTIFEKPDVFKEILDFALEDKPMFAMRAARAIQISATKYPELISPYMEDIIVEMDRFESDGLKRSFAKLISEISWDFNEDILGVLADACFKWVNDSKEKIALKAYSQDILYRISILYPDLKFELISVLERNYPHASVGIKTRSRKMLKKLKQEINEL